MKVIYIAAWGRSGTTIMDNILNGYPHVFSAGELHYLWERGILGKRWCGCGTPLPECALWARILDRAFGSDQPDPHEMVALQRRVTRVRQTPALARGELSPDARRYADILSRLYRAISDVTGATVIVDSSKIPSSAAVLARATDIEAYLLHVIRDPRAVAHSWMRPIQNRDRATVMKQHRPAPSSLYWLAWNGLTELIARRYPERHQRLRYEDFIADPRASMTALLELAGAPAPTDGPFRDDTTVVLEPNHTVYGNPGRFKVGTVSIRPDDAWVHDQQRSVRLATTAISMPLLHRYGYRLRPERQRPASNDPIPGSTSPRGQDLQ